MPPSRTLSEAVYAFLSHSRKEHGLTLDQVARAARTCGATWSPSTVSNIECEQASLALPTLVFLALALGDLTGRPLAVSDLLGTPRPCRSRPPSRSAASGSTVRWANSPSP